MAAVTSDEASMKLIAIFLILVGVLVYVQVERNDCYWHGFGHVSEWSSCVLAG
jgi:hypothetical protein